MSFDLGQQTSDDGMITTLTFSDPARHNQLCWAAIDQLADALSRSRTAGTRIIILASGLPGHWLQHAWLEDLCAGIEGREQTGSGTGWLQALQELANEDIISIAAISGDTSGGGAELGWACDFRIAESTARFAQPEIDMGLTTGIGGCSRLMRLAGPTTTTQMVLTGQPMPAKRLYELSALTELVEPGASLAAAMTVARGLATKPQKALHALKQILRRAEELPLAESLAFEQDIFQQVAVSDDAVRGMKSVQAAYDRAKEC